MNTINNQVSLTSLKPPKLDKLTRVALKEYFNNTWDLYEMLFSSIKADSTLYLSPEPLRNPLVFYLGHTAAFSVNKFKMAGLIKEGVNEQYDHLFAVGVDPNTPQSLEVSEFWPTIPQVRAYRETIYNLVHGVIDGIDEAQFPIKEDSPLWSIPMTLEHDRIHFETSSVLIRQLSVDLVEKPAGWKYAETFNNIPTNEWIDMQGGNVTIGKPDSSDLFGWDNEYGQLLVKVKPFKATKNLITNGEFWDFVIDGGYGKKNLWSKEGWDWKIRTNTSYPKFWVSTGNTFLYRAMFDEMSMPMDWPAEVNAHEAAAYCKWLNDGSRLLTEAEFDLIANEGQADSFDPLFEDGYNLDFVYGSPTPVGYMSGGTTKSGFNDIYGNVWDWLKDDFYGLPNFKVHPYYIEFSEPYMDEEHGMMAGGSWVTTGTGASKYYRLWFRRHFFQHAGFRLAKDC